MNRHGAIIHNFQGDTLDTNTHSRLKTLIEGSRALIPHRDNMPLIKNGFLESRLKSTSEKLCSYTMLM